jgi:multisubunit Na+/H+ antiporter MnhG subunit
LRFQDFFRNLISKEVISVSNVLGVIIGVVVIIVGLILLVVWWSMFVGVFKGILPILLIIIGAGVLIYFISEIKSKLEMGKEEAPASGEKKPE